MEVLLEVVAEREVEEGRLEGGQLHRRGEPALDDREIGRRVVAEEVRHERPHLDLRARGAARRRRAAARHQDHPGVRDLGGDQREGLGALPEQASPDPGTAHRDQDHPLVVAEAQLAAERGACRDSPRVEVVGVAGEAEVLARPLPHVRQVGPELAVEHVLLVADHDGEVAHVRVEAQVVDVLGVLLPARLNSADAGSSRMGSMPMKSVRNA